MNEGRVHDVGPFLLKLPEFYHFLSEGTVRKEAFPFWVHFISCQIFRGEFVEIDLFAELKETFRTTLDYLIVGQSPSEEEELLRKKICTKLHRIARSLDAVADDL